MGHEIPTLFVRGRWDPDTPVPTDWNEAIALLPDEVWQEPGPFQVTSRSGWCEALAVRVARGLGMGGLDFLEAEVSYLAGDSLAAARATAHTVFEQLALDRLPPLKVWAGDTEIEALRALGPDLVRSAPVLRDIHADSATTGFYSFLRSLVVEADAALASGVGLLVVRPQP